MDHLDRINRAKSVMFIKHPFFASLLLSRKLVISKEIKTALVDDKGNLYFSEAFLDKLKDDEIIFVLAHEVMHLALKHISRKGPRDSKLWNIACDACINEMLITQKVGKFVKGGVRYRGAESKTAEDIYQELLGKHKQCMLNSIPGVSYTDNDPEKGFSFGGLGEDIPERCSSHTVKQMEDTLDRQVIQASTIAEMCGRGRAPGYVRHMAELACSSTVPWQDTLSEFLTSLTVQDQNWARPNRRYLRLERHLPSIAKAPSMDHLIIGIDTSGSISNEMLAVFQEHVNSLITVCNPKTVTVIFCDAKVGRVVTYNEGSYPVSFKDPSGRVSGGGGTDLREIFYHIKDNNLPCDGLLLLTDGETPYLKRDDYNALDYPVMWAYTRFASYLLPEYPVQYVDLRGKCRIFG